MKYQNSNLFAKKSTLKHPNTVRKRKVKFAPRVNLTNTQNVQSSFQSVFASVLQSLCLANGNEVDGVW